MPADSPDTWLAGAWRWPHFSPDELRCQHCGTILMAAGFLDRLEGVRAVYGAPMPVTSGYRCPEHNKAISTTGADGPHTTGRAVDIAVRGAGALRLVRLALDRGFTGIGVSQKGARRFIHLDDLPEEPGCPRPTLWSY